MLSKTIPNHQQESSLEQAMKTMSSTTTTQPRLSEFHVSAKVFFGGRIRSRLFPFETKQETLKSFEMKLRSWLYDARLPEVMKLKFKDEEDWVDLVSDVELRDAVTVMQLKQKIPNFAQIKIKIEEKGLLDELCDSIKGFLDDLFCPHPKRKMIIAPRLVVPQNQPRIAQQAPLPSPQQPRLVRDEEAPKVQPATQIENAKAQPTSVKEGQSTKVQAPCAVPEAQPTQAPSIDTTVIVSSPPPQELQSSNVVVSDLSNSSSSQKAEEKKPLSISIFDVQDFY